MQILRIKWFVTLFALNFWLTGAAHSQTPAYDLGHMGGSSLGGKLPFEGAFFNKGSVADKPMSSQATKRSIKFAFRHDLGWYAIAYYPKGQSKAFTKEYGRFTVVSADKGENLFVITLYDPDYKGDFKKNVPNPSSPKDLSGRRQVATVELKVQGNELTVTVKNADSNQVSLASGDAFQMTPGQ